VEGKVNNGMGKKITEAGIVQELEVSRSLHERALIKCIIIRIWWVFEEKVAGQHFAFHIWSNDKIYLWS
jgi:hypothetical protein